MKISFLKAGLIAGLLMSMSPKEVLSQVHGGDQGPVIAQEFERDPNEQEIIRQMQIELRRLMQISLDTVEPASLSTPDYDVVKKVLQVKMSQSIVQYFEQLEIINKEITRTFSELIALKNYADTHEMDQNGPLHGEYLKDLKLKIPELHKKVNAAYTKAIKDLTTLSGAQHIAVRKNKNQFKDEVSYMNGLFGLCETRLCVKSLSAEIMNWNLFATNFNNRVDFINFNEGKVTTTENVRTSPFITRSLLDASSRMLNLGLESNKDYTVPGMMARYMTGVVKVPAAVATALIAAPVYMVEKPARLLKSMMSKTMKLELALKKQETYTADQIKKSLYAQVDEISKNKNSAIYYSETNKADTIRNVILKTHDNAVKDFKVQALSEFSNAELMDYITKEILTFEILMTKLTPERLLKLESELSAEQRETVLIQLAAKNPAEITKLSIDQMIKLLERKDIQIASYLPHIEKELSVLIKRSAIIAKKYQDHIDRPVNTPSSEFYTSLNESDDGNISIFQPKMYGSNAKLVPLNSSSSGSGSCALFGYFDGGIIVTASGDHSQTAKVGSNGFETYVNYASNSYNRAIDTLICFTQTAKISERYERIVKNLDGTSMIVKPVFASISNTTMKFSSASSGNSICALYGFSQSVGSPGVSGDESLTFVYKGKKSFTTKAYSSNSYNRGIDTITCR
jgi:hypothetical protein